MKRTALALLCTLTVMLGPGAFGQPKPPAQPAPKPAATALPAPAKPAAQAAVMPALRPDQVELLRGVLRAAPEQGFEEGEFLTPALDALLRSRDPAQFRQGEALLLRQTARYATALRHGRLSGADFDDEWGMRPEPFDAQAGLYAALVDNRLKAWLDDLPPPYLGYQQLIEGLKTYKALVARGGWSPVPAGPTMREGMDDPRVPALKARLAAEDPNAAKAFSQADAPAQSDDSSSAPAAADPLMFDAGLTKASTDFQARHGLDATGVVGKATLAELNITAKGRVEQIKANMERWRWAPRVMPADRVQVNIAAAVLTLFRGETATLSMRAIAGRVSDHTPMLQSTIRSIVFNPPWNVPASIATKEIWPKEKAHPGYLAKEDFVLIHTADGVRLQQKAGPKSALGQIKFDFDNRYGVYLHDTPGHTAFDQQSRLVSHGCVRLDQPRALALMLLNDQASWTDGRIAQTIDAGKTGRVMLTRPTAVLIFYWTAFAGSDGVMNFRADPYGWDKELMQRIVAANVGKA